MGRCRAPRCAGSTACRWGPTAATVSRPSARRGGCLDAFSLFGPALRRCDPETAHRLTLWALRRGLAPRAAAPDDPILASTLWGLSFGNPLGLAAGFDKDAQVMAAILGLGFRSEARRVGAVCVSTCTSR